MMGKSHPLTNFIVILTLLCMYIKWTVISTIGFVNADPKPKLWRYDVYSGRHFNDLTLPTTSFNDNVVKNPTLLIMYGPECAPEAMGLLNSIRPFGPPDYYLTVAMHDYVTYPKYIWYNMDEVDDLYSRYMNESDGRCLQVLYFQRGSRLTRPDIFTNKMTFFLWVWDKMFVHVWIQNELENTSVRVKQEGQGNPNHLGNLNPWQIIQVKVQISLYITVYNETSGDLIYYENVEPNSSWRTLRLTRELLSSFKVHPDWLVEKKRIKAELSEKAKRRQEDIAEIHLFNFKQPIYIKRFTDTGYRKVKIPEAVYQLIKTFYNDNKDRRIIPKGVTSHLTNEETVPVTMVMLPYSLKERLKHYLLQVMQDFCQCKLDGTLVQDIQEYHQGNVVRNHVDKPQHVISSLLQIYQDGKQGWDIEITGYDGLRNIIQLEAGEMLIHESSTLIHGRPMPYQGLLYASCLLSYKPIYEPWNWDRYFSEGHMYLTNGTVTYIVNDIDVKSTENLPEGAIKSEL